MAADPKVVFVATALMTMIGLSCYTNYLVEKERKEFDSYLDEAGITTKQRKAIYKAGYENSLGFASLVVESASEDREDQQQQQQGSESPSFAAATTSKAPDHPLVLTDAEILEAARKLRQRLIVRLWLQQQPTRIAANAQRLSRFFGSLDEATLFADDAADAVVGVAGLWSRAVRTLPKDQRELRRLKDLLWEQCLRDAGASEWSWGGMVVFSAFVATMVALVGMNHPLLSPEGGLGIAATKCSFFEFVTGKYLVPQNCKVSFDWEEPRVVGDTMGFTVKFYQRNGRPYPICNRDHILVEITRGSLKVASSVEVGSPDPDLAHSVSVKFTVRKAGEYKICVMIGNGHVRGSPFIKRFVAGPPDPLKTGFLHRCSTVVCPEGVPYPMVIEPRDEYGNPCNFRDRFDATDGYQVFVREIESRKEVPVDSQMDYDAASHRIVLPLRLPREGCYRVSVSYKGVPLKSGDFNVIVLNGNDTTVVQKNVSKEKHNIYYEARLVSCNGEKLPKAKKVYCYVSPKQFTVKEFILKIIPKRMFTFRVCPSTKFQFHGSSPISDYPSLTIDDGCQPEVTLAIRERNVVAATFTQFLMRNIGGSETFKDKREFFYHEVRKLHHKKYHDKLPLKVQREKILESSMRATKSFSVNDWCKNFEITFQGEQGLDWGGLRREWFELLCMALFDGDNNLFTRFTDDRQGLVHPNPRRPPHLKIKHFEFAGRIVGKCLYESALGGSYRQLVKARFTRSFLAQLIGLRVHYKYFEQDDPDLYVSKIKYILENDITDAGLTFSEEEYENGQLSRVVELTTGGSSVTVTQRNKLAYLDGLAQHRLANCVREEVDAFLRGLNDLIPDTLLSIFDEYELELLVCGTSQFSVADFKANHAVSGSSYEFRKVLDWFWTAVANFTEEEMARLLQFATGCSQLPPGGFAELSPRFQITAAPTFGTLPTAHTCFNQLCLPDYESYEHFEKALLLSINEGSEGFGLI